MSCRARAFQGSDPTPAGPVSRPHTVPRWLLPEGIADILPAESRRLEDLRRRLLDLYRTHGYELVQPPLVEHLESLLSGTGGSLGLRTVTLVDQLSGRMLGVRADMTPQVARIDAHLLNRRGVARLCYAGSVLHARPASLIATREPQQVGAELYGHAGLEADVEVIELMARSLGAAGVERVRIDLCHVGIVGALLARAEALDQSAVIEALSGKDIPGLRELAPVASSTGDAARAREGIVALASLHGEARAVLGRARVTLPPWPGVVDALDALAALLADPAWAQLPGVDWSVDLGDLRGYRYHSGITFAAYVDGLPMAVARGGRYDEVGRAFGRARPATGFSLELRELASLLPEAPPARAIRAPWSGDAALAARIAGLRAAGEIVVRTLPGHEHELDEFHCDRALVLREGEWTVVPLA